MIAPFTGGLVFQESIGIDSCANRLTVKLGAAHEKKQHEMDCFLHRITELAVNRHLSP